MAAIFPSKTIVAFGELEGKKLRKIKGKESERLIAFKEGLDKRKTI